jgi:FkbM family methyltransferase
MDNLIGSIRNFGVLEGLTLYFKLKNFQRSQIETSTLEHPVHLRPGSTDNCVFKQIFLKQDLNIPALEDIEPKRILDLGANIGMSSLYLKNRFPDAEIVGVEPDSSNGEMYRKNLRHYPDVSLLETAVRGSNQKVSKVDNGRGESGYEMKIDDEGCAAVTIPGIMEQYGWNSIDLVKIDIEGSEKSVFEGEVEKWLPKTKVLFVELHEMKAPGCTAAMHKALEPYDFLHQKSGEYEVLINTQTST